MARQSIDPGASKTPAGGGGKGDAGKNKIKIILAICGLFVGGALIAWNFGLLDGLFKATGIVSKPPDPNEKVTPEQRKAYEQRKKKLEEMQKDGTAPETAGS